MLKANGRPINPGGKSGRGFVDKNKSALSFNCKKEQAIEVMFFVKQNYKSIK